jgi:hypothetical protein
MAAFLPIGTGTGLARFKLSRLGFTISIGTGLARFTLIRLGFAICIGTGLARFMLTRLDFTISIGTGFARFTLIRLDFTISIGTGLAGFMLARLGFTISWWRCCVPLIILADGYSWRFRRPFAFIFVTQPPILLPVPKILEVALRFLMAREVGRRSRI